MPFLSKRPATAVLLAAAAVIAAVHAPAGAAVGPEPGTPEYTERDTRNMADAYGRITGPGGQLQNPAYLTALATEVPATSVAHLLEQAARPNHLALTPGVVFPGWDVGNPLRKGWDGTRGVAEEVRFTNRYGALLRGTVWRPKRGARDPYTGKVLRGPFPGVVITTGSVQGSEGMYHWLAQDLAERGYVVLTYDVQGQGESETFPHENNNALPFCNPFAEPQDGEAYGCPGVPAQQLSNFVVGTRDALSFFLSTPARPYANPRSADADVDDVNPYWRSFDRSPDPRPYTQGRRTRVAIVGHSLGAAAVSQVQGHDRRVAAVVALDKLSGGSGQGVPAETDVEPVVPALALQAEYGFTVSPWWLSGGSSLTPQPSPEGPDPRRERATGFDAWRKAGVDSMLVVPRSSTHLEWTDIPLVLPASRWGQALSSRYVQAWLGRYLKHQDTRGVLLAKRLRYLEPVAPGTWAPVTLRRDRLLSFYYCSAYDFRQGGRTYADPDTTGVGCPR